MEGRRSRHWSHVIPTLSLVVPVHDEQENVRELHRRTARVLDRHAIDFEVLFIDDGSTDATPELLDTLRREDLTFKRPGTGLLPFRIDDVIGKPLAREVEADVPLTQEAVQW